MERILVILPFLFLAACNLNDQAIDFSSINDFAKSSIIVSGKGIADDSTYHYFDVQLKNSNDSVVVGWKPSLSLPGSLSDNSKRWLCGKSNKQGIARCAMRSKTAGIFNVAVSNITTWEVESDLEFDYPIVTNLAKIVSGSVMNGSGGGYKVHATLNHTQTELSQSLPGGYKIFRGISGMHSSQ